MSPIKLEDFFTNLEKSNDIFLPKSNANTEKISYPEEGYDNIRKLEENSFWFKHRNNCLHSLMKQFSPNEILFDIGGGSGAVSYFMQKQGVKVVLIEPGFEGARHAAKRGIPSIAATFEELELNPNARVMSVGLFDVIEHIEDDIGFLKKLRGFVADDGLVYITVPSYQFLWSMDDTLAGHYRRYTLSELNKKLIASGFQPVFSSYFFSLLILPIFLFRVLPSKLGKRNNELKQEQKEHSEEGLLAKLLAWGLGFEEKLIKGLISLPLGASCIVVARKKA